jgi:hypothetical protein
MFEREPSYLRMIILLYFLKIIIRSVSRVTDDDVPTYTRTQKRIVMRKEITSVEIELG